MVKSSKAAFSSSRNDTWHTPSDLVGSSHAVSDMIMLAAPVQPSYEQGRLLGICKACNLVCPMKRLPIVIQVQAVWHWCICWEVADKTVALGYLTGVL